MKLLIQSRFKLYDSCSSSGSVKRLNKEYKQQMEAQILQTLTFILRETFSRYCPLHLATCFGEQHWETIPSSVSQTFFIVPAIEAKATVRKPKNQ